MFQKLNGHCSAHVNAFMRLPSSEGMTMLLITHDEHVAARVPRMTSIIDGQLTEH